MKGRPRTCCVAASLLGLSRTDGRADVEGTSTELSDDHQRLSQVMNRLKAVYQSWGIPCAGKLVYTRRHRAGWLQKLPEAGIRSRVEHLYQQLDMLRCLRQDAKQERLAESRKHPAARLLCQILCIGPIRAAVLIALIQTLHHLRAPFFGGCHFY